jgi:hypothetical protein
MAVCGLDCGPCDIRLAPTDRGAAGALVAWFRQMGWLSPSEGMAEVIDRAMYCCGCHGDRSIHWSADCWILRCCVDEKGLAHCHECDQFPCDRLEAWAATSPRYTAALKRLHSLVDG